MGDLLTIHTTSLQDAGRTGSEAVEPTRRTSRFDERGVALQTVIIIVVMLAIAGAVAGVLLNRAGQTTDQLENTDNIEWSEIDSESACRIAGGTWSAGACT